ncbi:MAG TPA: hypothetical protein VIH63_11080 [Xanthobacteraceae bacterium]
MRDPADPRRFFLSRSLAAKLLAELDVLKYDLTGQPMPRHSTL